MAVLLRSARDTVPALRRSLAAAGVPVEVAGDETPLVHEPAVAPLLDALRVVALLAQAVHRADGAQDSDRAGDVLDALEDPVEMSALSAAEVSPELARSLVTSPLAGLDATDVRAVSRALRLRDRVHAESGGRPVLGSEHLLRDALLDPGKLEPLLGSGGLVGDAARAAQGLALLLRTAADELLAGASAETVLWRLWDGTRWPQRLRAGVDRGGASARHAHRDLDAVNALFEAAARMEEQQGLAGVETLRRTLRAQQIPGDTLADTGVRGEAVRLLTAHRSKGLEWDLVVAAHVQEEVWPDLRRRASLLAADRLGPADAAGRPVLLPADDHARAARRGETAVLRRLHPGAAPTRRHRRLGPAPRTASDPPGSSTRCRRPVRAANGCTWAGARVDRSRSPVWSPSCAAPRPTRPSPSHCGRPRPAGSPRSPPAPARSRARGCRRRTRPVGGARAAPRRPRSRSRPADEPVRLSASALSSLVWMPHPLVPRARGRRRRTPSPAAGLRQRRARARRPGSWRRGEISTATRRGSSG